MFEWRAIMPTNGLLFLIIRLTGILFQYSAERCHCHSVVYIFCGDDEISSKLLSMLLTGFLKRIDLNTF